MIWHRKKALSESTYQRMKRFQVRYFKIVLLVWASFEISCHLEKYRGSWKDFFSLEHTKETSFYLLFYILGMYKSFFLVKMLIKDKSLSTFWKYERKGCCNKQFMYALYKIAILIGKLAVNYVSFVHLMNSN